MTPQPVDTFLTFYSEQDARTYRHEHGTGGWIFVPEDPGPIVLYPPNYSPSMIFHHPMVRGLTGNLIGHG